MNFQNDEGNGRVRVLHQINHTKMIVVIPKSTQRIDFTMTLIMMKGFTPVRALLKCLQLNPCPARSSSSAPWAPACKAAPWFQAAAWRCPWAPPTWVTSSFQSPGWAQRQQTSEVNRAPLWTRKQPHWLCLSESEWREERTGVFHVYLLNLHNYLCAGCYDLLPLSDELTEAQRGQLTQRFEYRS